MFQLSQAFVPRPVMSLRTGGKIATTTSSIINPNNLKIEGFYCQDQFEKKKQLVLLAQDIRDVIDNGLVVNDHEVLAQPTELVRLKEVLQINFQLVGKPVFTDTQKRIGKVMDFAVDKDTLYVQKLYVSQSLIKNLAGGNLSVDRSQIVEITNRKIVIKDPEQFVPIAENEPVATQATPATAS